MDEMEKDLPQEEKKYVPRPKWQVVAAWIGLIIFVLTLIAYYLNVFRGGI